MEDLSQSKADPGVLGVLLAEPKDAKAPDPRPNAEDLPVTAEVLVLSGAMPFDSEGRLELRSPEETRDLVKGRLELSLDRSVLCLWKT